MNSFENPLGQSVVWHWMTYRQFVKTAGGLVLGRKKTYFTFHILVFLIASSVFIKFFATKFLPFLSVAMSGCSLCVMPFLVRGCPILKAAWHQQLGY